MCTVLPCYVPRLGNDLLVSFRITHVLLYLKFSHSRSDFQQFPALVLHGCQSEDKPGRLGGRESLRCNEMVEGQKRKASLAGLNSRHLPRSLPHPTLQVILQQFWMDVLRTTCPTGLVFEAVRNGEKLFISTNRLGDLIFCAPGIPLDALGPVSEEQ